MSGPMSPSGPSLQIAAIGVGSRFWGIADVHSGQSPFSRFQALTWTLSPRISLQEKSAPGR
jgi:hypothetical protein